MVGHSIFPVAAQFTKDYYHLPERPEDIMAEWMDLAGDAYANHVPLKPGAAEFLARCAAAGEHMVLVTACVPQLCRAVLARHGLSNAFSPIIFAQELGIEKRDPRFFQTVLERLGAAPEDCTLFEDSPGACQDCPGGRYPGGGGVRRLLQCLAGRPESQLPPVYPRL